MTISFVVIDRGNLYREIILNAIFDFVNVFNEYYSCV